MELDSNFELLKFRKRWHRWLGQMTRLDRCSWTELFDTNWSGWAYKVLEKHNKSHLFILLTASVEEIKKFYFEAIECSDMHDLMKLDNIWCSVQIDKLG